MLNEELKLLKLSLKSGEYDGTHIMQAWIAVDELIKLKSAERVRRERERLLVLATKHCPKDHHDWAEILVIAND